MIAPPSAVRPTSSHITSPNSPDGTAEPVNNFNASPNPGAAGASTPIGISPATRKVAPTADDAATT